MKDGANWLAWGLHFFFGCVLGAFFSVFFLRGNPRGIPLVTHAMAPWFALGVGFMVGAYAARHGDRFWRRSSYWMIPPDEPLHSPASLRATRVAFWVGLIIAAFAVGASFVSLW